MGQTGLILLARRIKGRPEDRVDQIMHRPPAAAMRERHMGISQRRFHGATVDSRAPPYCQ